ncbi:hypothetical protein MKX03_034829 [Papaver bracteatum]|nr:hypothetical protein MKX03_034829 [Papaver bracteatum]
MMDADDVRIFLDGHDVSGIRIIVAFAKGMLIYWIIGHVAKVANLFLPVAFMGSCKGGGGGGWRRPLLHMCGVFLICCLSLFMYNDVEQTPMVVVPNIQMVGNAFTEQYYHILHQYSELVYRGFESFKVDQGQMVLCQQYKTWMFCSVASKNSMTYLSTSISNKPNQDVVLQVVFVLEEGGLIISFVPLLLL